MSFRSFFPVIALSFTFLFIGPIEPWSSALPLFVRAITAFVIVCISLVASKQPLQSLVMSPPLVFLALTATLSINQFLRLNIAQDWLAFVLVAVIAVLAVSMLDLKQLVASVALSGLLLAGYTLVLVLSSPRTAIDEAGLWMGAFTGKNNLALALMFTVPAIIAFSPVKQSWWKRAVKTLLVAGLFAIILQTKSASSIVAFVLTTLAYLALLLVRKYRKSLRWVILAGAISSIVAYLNFATILSLLSKGSDLTGRLPLWESSMNAMEDKWLTGYGWSYLFGYESPAALFIWSETGQFFLHSHNELIFWFVMTGAVGVLFLLATYISTGIFGIKYSVFNSKDLQLWIPLGILGLVFGGITEISSAYIQGWFILALLATSVSKYIADKQERFPFNLNLFIEWKIRFSTNSGK